MTIHFDARAQHSIGSSQTFKKIAIWKAELKRGGRDFENGSARIQTSATSILRRILRLLVVLGVYSVLRNL